MMGVLLGRIRLLHDLLDPIMELLRYLSPTAMIPIAVIWFGIGELSKYFLIFWGTFFIVLINTTAGVLARANRKTARCRVPRCWSSANFRVSCRAFGDTLHRYRHARCDGFILHEHHSCGNFGCRSGIGYLLQKSSMLLQTNRIFVALLTICVLGFIVDRLFRLLVDRVLARYMSIVSQT